MHQSCTPSEVNCDTIDHAHEFVTEFAGYAELAKVSRAVGRGLTRHAIRAFFQWWTLPTAKRHDRICRASILRMERHWMLNGGTPVASKKLNTAAHLIVGAMLAWWDTASYEERMGLWRANEQLGR